MIQYESKLVKQESEWQAAFSGHITDSTTDYSCLLALSIYNRAARSTENLALGATG